jgi:hypothetical protein
VQGRALFQSSHFVLPFPSPLPLFILHAAEAARSHTDQSGRQAQEEINQWRDRCDNLEDEVRRLEVEKRMDFGLKFGDSLIGLLISVEKCRQLLDLRLPHQRRRRLLRLSSPPRAAALRLQDYHSDPAIVERARGLARVESAIVTARAGSSKGCG